MSEHELFSLFVLKKKKRWLYGLIKYSKAVKNRAILWIFLSSPFLPVLFFPFFFIHKYWQEFSDLFLQQCLIIFPINYRSFLVNTQKKYTTKWRRKNLPQGIKIFILKHIVFAIVFFLKGIIELKTVFFSFSSTTRIKFLL